MRSIRLGRVAGLDLSCTAAALWGSVGLGLLVGGIGAGVLRWSAGLAVGMAMLGVALHWIGEFLHQIGHALAASRTGYPMVGVRFGVLALLSASLYPADEPPLPARVHIRRALGGPLLSMLIALAAGAAWLALRGRGGLPSWLILAVALENALVFGIGAQIPLGFNDGSTLLHWRGRD